MSDTKLLGVGVIGAHAWAEKAHLPGFAACERVRRVAICDTVPERAQAMAAKFGFARVYTDHAAMLADPDIDMVDVCTPTGTHAAISADALNSGRHVLCEKPLALNAATAFSLARTAEAARLRTKIGFTFRYSPAIRQIKAWISEGAMGEIFHVHGFQQNSQFLDPNFPLRQYGLGEVGEELIAASIVGYGSHLVDLMRWCAGEFSAVSASMRNFIPQRMVRGKQGLQRVPVEDGTVAAIEFASGAQGVLQTSFIAIGNYPGVELRVYGSKMAAIARLIVEGGIAETLQIATADAVEFRPYALPADAFAPGTTVTTPWPELYYRNLVRHWAAEILDDLPADNTFRDGAKSQEIVDAIVQSHHERRWVTLNPTSAETGT
jgi:predicted dehydrogenase